VELVGGRFSALAASSNINYKGNDKAVFLVDLKGYKIKVVYYFKVVDFGKYGIDELYAKSENCPTNPDIWKISNATYGLNTEILGSYPFIVDSSACTLNYPVIANGYDNLTPTFNFNNLTGAAVGETKGSGINATITLDTDAAGHGWYIDYTPYLNEDFLPTSAIGCAEVRGASIEVTRTMRLPSFGSIL
jgi:hypothetical protein